MADPTPVVAAPIVMPTGWRANPSVARLMSLHFWMGIVAILLAGAKTRAWAQPYSELIDYVLTVLTPGTVVMASIYKSPLDRAKLASVDVAGTGAVTSPPPVALLILFPLLFTFGCGHIPVVPSAPPSAQYEAALVQCLQDEGIPAAPGVGAQVWNILMTPGWTQQQIVAKLEAIGVTIGGKGAQIIVSCSVLSWFEIFPVASGTAPTPAQAAARVYKAKYRKVLKAHDTGAHQ